MPLLTHHQRELERQPSNARTRAIKQGDLPTSAAASPRYLQTIYTAIVSSVMIVLVLLMLFMTMPPIPVCPLLLAF
jgi:hypothetical protein